MRQVVHLIIGLLFVLGTISSYAITVRVQSPSVQVSALGFTVNGKNYGGAGKSYSKANSPVGTYTFGVRVGGLFGTDVGCPVSPRPSVSLKNDATVTLIYDGTHCIARVR